MGRYTAAALLFADGSVDAVLRLEVLEYVRDPAAVMTEIARVLRPRGHLWLLMHFLYPVHDAPCDFQRHTAHGLQRDFRRADSDQLSLMAKGGSVPAAGLLVCLALAGGVQPAGRAVWLLVPFAIPLILLVNLGGALFGLVWPMWPALSAGHQLLARKPR